MTDKNIVFRAGSLLCLTTGEYSDYYIQGHFVALQDIRQTDIAATTGVAKAIRYASDKEWDDWGVDEEGPTPPLINLHKSFIAAMIRGGFLMDVTCKEMHLGGFGELDVS